MELERTHLQEEIRVVTEICKEYSLVNAYLSSNDPGRCLCKDNGVQGQVLNEFKTTKDDLQYLMLVVLELMTAYRHLMRLRQNKDD